MKSQWLKRVALLAVLVLCAGCSNPHYFPRLRPLFVGLDESHVPASARKSLANAKVDFQRARQGKSPRYAHYTGMKECTCCKVYEGSGYTLTLVDKGVLHMTGPDIQLDSSITGGAPFHYAEVGNELE